MLYEALENYTKKNIAPFHMPGHKRNTRLLGKDLPYDIDITEIDGFDNLQDMQGILKQVAERAAALYSCQLAFPLVNGGTGGILAAVKSAVHNGDTIIMARNCHKSVYNAVELFGLKPIYLLPETDENGIAGSIRPEQVQTAVDMHPDATLVVVTSPTYEGVVSDIRSISDIAHKKNVPVLVDSAHGAHLGFSDYFPLSAVSCGADLVVVSLHKTLPALTQSALVLLNGNLIKKDRLCEAVTFFQTSSPSYVLLASIDRCLELLETGRKKFFDAYIENLQVFDTRIAGLENLRVLCHGAQASKDCSSFFSFDPGKLVISVQAVGLTGAVLAEHLRTTYQIELEMTAADYAVAMTSICDTAEHFERLADALNALDALAEMKSEKRPAVHPVLPDRSMSVSAACVQQGVFMQLAQAAGCVALEYIWAYPPGIPLLVPGERITDGLVAMIERLAETGVAVKSTRGQLPRVYATDDNNTYL